MRMLVRAVGFALLVVLALTRTPASAASTRELAQHNYNRDRAHRPVGVGARRWARLKARVLPVVDKRKHPSATTTAKARRYILEPWFLLKALDDEPFDLGGTSWLLSTRSSRRRSEARRTVHRGGMLPLAPCRRPSRLCYVRSARFSCSSSFSVLSMPRSRPPITGPVRGAPARTRTGVAPRAYAAGG